MDAEMKSNIAREHIYTKKKAKPNYVGHMQVKLRIVAAVSSHSGLPLFSSSLCTASKLNLRNSSSALTASLRSELVVEVL